MLRVARRTSGSVLGQDRGRPTVPSLVLRRSASQDRSWRELPIEGDMSVKFSRLLVPKIHLWSTGNSPPVPKGSWPAVAAECFVTFVVDCEASDWYLGKKSGAMGVVRRGHQVRKPSPSEMRNHDALDNDQRTIGNTESRSHSRGRNLREMEDGLSAPRLQTCCDAATSGVAETSGMRCSAGLCRDTKPKSPQRHGRKIRLPRRNVAPVREYRTSELVHRPQQTEAPDAMRRKKDPSRRTELVGGPQ